MRLILAATSHDQNSIHEMLFSAVGMSYSVRKPKSSRHTGLDDEIGRVCSYCSSVPKGPPETT